MFRTYVGIEFIAVVYVIFVFIVRSRTKGHGVTVMVILGPRVRAVQSYVIIPFTKSHNTGFKKLALKGIFREVWRSLMIEGLMLANLYVPTREVGLCLSTA
jgi:hypothetical protein